MKRAFRRSELQHWSDGGGGSVRPVACMGIFAVNVAVFSLWKTAEASPRQPARSGEAAPPFAAVTPSLAWMQDHFTLSWHNLLDGRWHTLLTSSFSHTSSKHLFMNAFTLLLFASQVEMHYLGTSPFILMYVSAAVVSSAAHLWYPWLDLAWREGRWYTEEEASVWNALHSRRGSLMTRTAATTWSRTAYGTESRSRFGLLGQARSIALTRSPFASIPDRPALGASGSLSACISSATLLNPWAPMAFIPIPLWSVAAYYMYDDWEGLRLNDGIGHASHLGGALFGVAYFILFLRHRRSPFIRGFHSWRSRAFPTSYPFR